MCLRRPPLLAQHIWLWPPDLFHLLERINNSLQGFPLGRIVKFIPRFVRLFRLATMPRTLQDVQRCLENTLGHLVMLVLLMLMRPLRSQQLPMPLLLSQQLLPFLRI